MKHPGELTLRRHLAGEAVNIEAHLATCVECAARLQTFLTEQQQFEAQIPFERFAAGVERAVREQQKPRRQPWGRRGLALAAAGLLAVGAWVVLQPAPASRIKGGADVEFVIAGAQGQRPAVGRAALSAGDRVRIGVHGARYVVALSIDDRGEVSELYAQPVSTEPWLPDSLEFTGSGLEHVVVIVDDAPVDAKQARAALIQQYTASQRDLDRIESIAVPGVQVHRTFLKP